MSSRAQDLPVTTLTPSPNWYADPSGRHEARYWDGFTWTAHVADRGTLGLDPLVRSAPLAAAPPVAGATPVGHGTARLQAMAAASPARAADAAPVTAAPGAQRPPRRRSRAYEATAGLAIVVVLVLGGSTLWRSWRTSDAGGSTEPSGTVVFAGDGYQVDIPPSWVATSVPSAAEADGAWAVIDSSRLIALVGKEALTPAAATDDAALEQLVVDAVAVSFAGDGAATAVVERGVERDGLRRTGRAVVDATAVDGTSLRAAEYVLVTPRGSVAVGIVGRPDAVDRHLAEAARVARTARVG